MTAPAAFLDECPVCALHEDDLGIRRWADDALDVAAAVADSGSIEVLPPISDLHPEDRL